MMHRVRKLLAWLRGPARPWICFHCGFETCSEAEAEAHFGERDDAPEFTPTCRWWRSTPEADRVRAYQDLLKELAGERDRCYRLQVSNDGLEYQVNSHRGAIKSYRPFRQCNSINDVFLLYDSMEGRALAAEEELASRGPADPQLTGLAHQEEKRAV